MSSGPSISSEELRNFVESELERKVDELKMRFDEDSVEEVVEVWKNSG